MNNKIAEIVTKTIMQKLEDGVAPWYKPWKSFRPMNYVSKRPYRGFNRLVLAMSENQSPYYMTYNQAKSLGGQVKKGEKGYPVVFWKMIQTDELDSNGKVKKVPYLRYYTVFNSSQIDGIDFKEPDGINSHTREQSIGICDSIISGYPEKKPSIVAVASDEAMYVPDTDTIVCPEKGQYDDIEDYYLVLFHELSHSTGHVSRLNRKIVNQHGSYKYGVEELVAEICTAFLAQEAGIADKVDRSAAYCKAWLEIINEQPGMIITAAGKAEKAFEYILGIEEEEVETNVAE